MPADRQIDGVPHHHQQVRERMSNQYVGCDPKIRWAGYIKLDYVGKVDQEIVLLGAAGFKTMAELDENWSRAACSARL